MLIARNALLHTHCFHGKSCLGPSVKGSLHQPARPRELLHRTCSVASSHSRRCFSAYIMPEECSCRRTAHTACQGRAACMFLQQFPDSRSREIERMARMA